MRARDLFLALLIIAGGVIVTAAHRGVFAGWQRDLADLSEFRLPFDRSWVLGEGWRELEHFTREIDAAGATVLIVENPNGQVTVTGGKQGEVRVEALPYGRGRSLAQATARARLVSMTLARSGTVIRATVTSTTRLWQEPRLDLHITAPASLSLQVKTASGLVDVQGMKGNVRIEGRTAPHWSAQAALFPRLQYQANAYRTGEDVG